MQRFMILFLFFMSALLAGEGLLKNLNVNNFSPASSPTLDFKLTPQLLRDDDDNEKLTLKLTLAIGADSSIYADDFSVSANNNQPLKITKTALTKIKENDPRPVYLGNVELFYQLPATIKLPLKITVAYQGCSGKMCFMPTAQHFTINENEVIAIDDDGEKNADENPTITDAVTEWKKLADDFVNVTQISGFVEVDDFVNWLTNKPRDQGVGKFLDEILDDYGLWAVAILIIPLGLLLNLTPCVLPIIPINLAIIGAAQMNAKKQRSLWLGLLYGGGIAVIYGVLGLVVVLTGSRFGALNSLPIFNFTIAGVFIALALAMFDFWHLDFSSLNKTTINHRQNPYLGAFLLGGLTALLAGACVAPVLIWVLVLATDLYAKENFVGLLLPFLLGLGMALPWPFLAAGVSHLPKPGKWMVRVKQIFGGLILCVAINYLSIGISLVREQKSVAENDNEIILSGWQHDLVRAMKTAQAENKSLLINFSGLACSSCWAMKRSTLINEKVTALLNDYIKVEFLTDDLNDPLIKAVQKHYEIVGIPTYMILMNDDD